MAVVVALHTRQQKTQSQKAVNLMSTHLKLSIVKLIDFGPKRCIGRLSRLIGTQRRAYSRVPTQQTSTPSFSQQAPYIVASRCKRTRSCFANTRVRLSSKQISTTNCIHVLQIRHVAMVIAVVMSSLAPVTGDTGAEYEASQYTFVLSSQTYKSKLVFACVAQGPNVKYFDAKKGSSACVCQCYKSFRLSLMFQSLKL